MLVYAGTGVLIMAATNRFGDLDPALIRPGRFDWKISITNPNRTGREEILKACTSRVIPLPCQDSIVISMSPAFAAIKT